VRLITVLLVADCALGGRSNELGILMKDSTRVFMWQRLPSDLASLKLCWLDQEIELAVRDIDANAIAILDKCDWSPINSLWRNVPYAETS
jgi:hypothetical protein